MIAVISVGQAFPSKGSLSQFLVFQVVQFYASIATVNEAKTSSFGLPATSPAEPPHEPGGRATLCVTLFSRPVLCTAAERTGPFY